MARLSTMEDHHWSLLGKCTTVDPDMMFPNDGNKEAIAEAKAVCAGCPVLEQCLEERTRRGDRHGVWGGMSKNDRDAKYRRELRAKERAELLVEQAAA